MDCDAEVERVATYTSREHLILIFSRRLTHADLALCWSAFLFVTSSIGPSTALFHKIGGVRSGGFERDVENFDSSDRGAGEGNIMSSQSQCVPLPSSIASTTLLSCGNKMLDASLESAPAHALIVVEMAASSVSLTLTNAS